VLLWVGGLIGLLLLSTQQRVIALPRFSRIAFWSANVVVITGVVNAYTRFAKPSEIFSFYGLILSFKVFFTVGIIYFGYRQRTLLSGAKHLNQLIRSKKNEGEVESLNSSGSMVKSREWLVQELFLMLTTFILGGWLSTLTPPTPQINTLPTPALDITGEQMPAAPNLSRLFWMYRPDVIFLGALILGSILYYVGVRTLVKRGDKWPIGRTISFIIFIGLTDYATSGGLGIYARFAFSFHMIAHMLIGMVAPIFFVLSAPITLALRTLPSGRVENEKGLRQALMGVIHSRYVNIITHPLLALAFLDGSLFVLYFTPLFGTLMHSHVGHILMSVHFFAAGALFFYVIIGVDPNPRNTPFIARIVLVFAAMSIHAFFSIALLGTSTLLDGGYFASLERPWHLNLLADQHLGGSIGWSLSEVPILLALVATFIQWNRADDKEQKRIERAEIRARESGEKDELDLYNDYLKRLNEANER
jgi:putative copper resistance protein D